MVTAQLTEEATSKFAQLPWTRLHYNEAGTGDPPVILLHGSGAGASSWSNFVQNIGPLSEHYRVLAVDQPGYGKSDVHVLTEPRNTTNARAVKDLLDVLGIEKASLVGNSMGGATALAFAVDYPERLHKMVLMGSGGGGPAMFTVAPTDGARALMQVYHEPTFENLRKMFDLMLYNGASVPDDVLRKRADSMEANRPHINAYLQSGGYGPQRSLVDLLPKVQTRALIIHGRNDRVVPMEGSLSLLSLLPNSELHVFNRCGHWVQYEHAAAFNRMVLDFLAHDD